MGLGYTKLVPSLDPKTAALTLGTALTVLGHISGSMSNKSANVIPKLYLAVVGARLWYTKCSAFPTSLQNRPSPQGNVLCQLISVTSEWGTNFIILQQFV